VIFTAIFNFKIVASAGALINIFPPVFLNSKVSQSDLAFRHLCRDYGTQLCFSQMIHSKNFVSGTTFQQNHLDVYREKKERILLTHSGLNALDNLDWNWDRLSLKSGLLKNDYDRILRHEKESTNLFTSWSEYTESALIVQIAGHDPEVMSSAARKMLSLTNSADTDIGSYQGSISGIDINCGCPQGIAKKGRYGAFLMEESVDTVCNILKKLRNDLPETVGVSAKIRIPKQIETNAGKIEMKTRIHKLIDAGCDMITVHGRNIEENKTKCRSSNWDAIALAVQIAREYSDYENYPVIANGGLEVPSDVSKMMDYTKASAVMSAEALLENPGIFLPGAVDDNEITPAKLFERQINYCYEYLDLCVQYPPLPVSMGKRGGSFNCIRSHMFKILYRYLEENPDLRQQMASTKVNSIQEVINLVVELERRYFSMKSDTEWTKMASSNVQKSSWYRRHRESNESIRSRGSKVSLATARENNLSLEERKKQVKERIQILKSQRLQDRNKKIDIF